MRVLIISDTHRSLENLRLVQKKCGHIDLCLHAGDVEADEEKIRNMIECPLYMVSGNNDYLGLLEDEKEFYMNKYRVLLTHGHRYLVSLDTSYIKEEAFSRGVDIVIYGHTHKPLISEENGLVILCPGSISYPRQEGRKPTYIIIDIDSKGEAKFTLNSI